MKIVEGAGRVYVAQSARAGGDEVLLSKACRFKDNYSEILRQNGQTLVSCFVGLLLNDRVKDIKISSNVVESMRECEGADELYDSYMKYLPRAEEEKKNGRHPPFKDRNGRYVSYDYGRELVVLIEGLMAEDKESEEVKRSRDRYVELCARKEFSFSLENTKSDEVREFKKCSRYVAFDLTVRPVDDLDLAKVFANSRSNNHLVKSTSVYESDKFEKNNHGGADRILVYHATKRD